MIVEPLARTGPQGPPALPERQGSRGRQGRLEQKDHQGIPARLVPRAQLERPVPKVTPVLPELRVRSEPREPKVTPARLVSRAQLEWPVPRVTPALLEPGAWQETPDHAAMRDCREPRDPLAAQDSKATVELPDPKDPWAPRASWEMREPQDTKDLLERPVLKAWLEPSVRLVRKVPRVRSAPPELRDPRAWPEIVVRRVPSARKAKPVRKVLPEDRVRKVRPDWLG